MLTHYNYCKTARVCLIFKEGVKSNFSNYRLKPVCNQLYDFIDANKLLSNAQSGFRSFHSVATCLLKCTDNWYINMDNFHYTPVLFIDIEQDFDTVAYPILLKKLDKYGNIGIALGRLKSYLKSLRQLSRVNDKGIGTKY